MQWPGLQACGCFSEGSSSVRVHSALDGFSESQNSPTALNVPQRLEKLVVTANHHRLYAGPSAALGVDSRDKEGGQLCRCTHARTLQPELRWTAKQLSRLGGCTISKIQSSASSKLDLRAACRLRCWRLWFASAAPSLRCRMLCQVAQMVFWIDFFFFLARTQLVWPWFPGWFRFYCLHFIFDFLEVSILFIQCNSQELLKTYFTVPCTVTVQIL